MIEHIHLQNFKASRDVAIRIAPLTVLAGLNSSGKSSILQAIALLRQSYGIAAHANSLLLGGDLIQLGHGRDVLSEGADVADDVIIFTMRDGGTEYRWSCPTAADATELEFRDKPDQLPAFIRSSNFQFLQAGPRNPLASLSASTTACSCEWISRTPRRIYGGLFGDECGQTCLRNKICRMCGLIDSC